MAEVCIEKVLRKHREQFDLSAEAAAAQIGTTLSSYERWESGEIIPNRQNRELIRAWLGLSEEAMGWLTWQTKRSHDRRKACSK